MKHFGRFLTEAEDQNEPKKVADDKVSVFGRHNPPHLGHGLTLDRASNIAGSIGDKSPADQSFYTSRSQDPKKNPLPFEMKLQYLRKMFPQHQDKWDDDGNVKTVLNAATKAHQEGYKNFHFVGGQDRKQQMEDLLRKYNGNLYNFNNIYSHSAGDRDEKSDDPIQKLSASKMRRHAMNNDFDGFSEGLSFNKNYTMDDAKRMFSTIQEFMKQGKNEEWEVDSRKYKLVLEKMYRDGWYYEVNDWVEHLPTGLVGRVHRCGSNHLICVTEDNVMFKSFIHDVQHI